MQTSFERTTQTDERLRSYRHSMDRLLAPLDHLGRESASLVAGDVGTFSVTGRLYSVRRYLFIGPQGGDIPIRLGIFAGLHGDEPAGPYAAAQLIRLMDQYPEVARGYCLSVYPVCNPTGFEDNTRHSWAGRDLNREFWSGSAEPEVTLLERELSTNAFHGLISLHSDDTSEGVYGYARGATLTQNLLRPALEAAAAILPLNQEHMIDGFPAQSGIIHDGHPGMLTAPAEARPRPFEITFETPQEAPLYLQQQALVVALVSVLEEYRKLVAYAANL